MPKRSKGKNQREDWNQGDDWLEDEAESSTEPDYVNNNNGVTGRNGEENHNDRGGRRDRKGTNSQSSRAIEPVTQAARDTSEILSQALKEIEKLNTLCAKCADDIEAVANTHQKYRELQEQCKEKDVKIDEQKAIIRGWGNAINDIEEMSRKEIFDKEEEFGNQLALFEEEKKSFEKSKKTLKAEKAEQEHKLNEELKKLKEEQDKKFKTRLDNLEKSIKQREDANEKKLKDLEAHNKKLVESLTAKESKIVDLDGKVKKIKERKEEQIMLKNSFKDEKEGLQKKLAAIENEFGMTSQTTDF
jgi:chromosome segregation ATPase